MPELDQTLRALLDDVSSASRPPGAGDAIARGRRRLHARVAMATVVVLAAVAGGSALAAGALDGGDQGPSVVASPPPSPPPYQEDPAVEGADFRNGLRRALTGVPGWAVAVALDTTVLHPCGEDWSAGATGGSGGTVSLTDGEGGPVVWSDLIGFRSDAAAAGAVTRLVEELESCEVVSWAVTPIGGTGAVLVTTQSAVVWVHREGSGVSTLQVPTTDGAPPDSVQVEVADLVLSWLRQPR